MDFIYYDPPYCSDEDGCGGGGAGEGFVFDVDNDQWEFEKDNQTIAITATGTDGVVVISGENGLALTGNDGNAVLTGASVGIGTTAIGGNVEIETPGGQFLVNGSPVMAGVTDSYGVFVGGGITVPANTTDNPDLTLALSSGTDIALSGTTDILINTDGLYSVRYIATWEILGATESGTRFFQVSFVPGSSIISQVSFGSIQSAGMVGVQTVGTNTITNSGSSTGWFEAGDLLRATYSNTDDSETSDLPSIQIRVVRIT